MMIVVRISGSDHADGDWCVSAVYSDHSPFLYRCWGSSYVLFLKVLCFFFPAFWPPKKLQKVAGLSPKSYQQGQTYLMTHKLARLRFAYAALFYFWLRSAQTVWSLDGKFAALLLADFAYMPRPLAVLRWCSVKVFCWYGFRTKVFSHFVLMLYDMGDIVSWGWFLKGPSYLQRAWGRYEHNKVDQWSSKNVYCCKIPYSFLSSSSSVAAELPVIICWASVHTEERSQMQTLLSWLPERSQRPSGEKTTL